MDAIQLPTGITLPGAFGAPVAPVQAGQVIQALVLELIESDIFRLQLPQAVVDVRSSVPLTPGTTVTLAVKAAGANARFSIYADTRTASWSPGEEITPPSLAGREPIGEAVVIARAAGQGPPVAPPSAPRRPDLPAAVVTPEQAVQDAVRRVAPRQAGLAPLFADLEPIAQAANETTSSIPAAVRRAAADVLSLRVPLDEKIAAPDVKQAFMRSGVLFEARLAATAARSTPSRVAPPAKDLKVALLVLREVVKTWSDSDTVKPGANALAGPPDELPQSPPLSAEQAITLAKSLAAALVKRDAASTSATPNPVPPPYRGAPFAAQPPVAPSIAADAASRQIADQLLSETDGALARQTLLQVASLPAQPDTPRTEPTQRWNFEVPFATPQGTAIAQFEISRDGRAAHADPQARTWRARFSLDVEPIGPIHALIALAGTSTSVTLWAERPATAARLNQNAAMLNDALRAAELAPADFQTRVGAPPIARQPAGPGRFMDRAS